MLRFESFEQAALMDVLPPTVDGCAPILRYYSYMKHYTPEI